MNDEQWTMSNEKGSISMKSERWTMMINDEQWTRIYPMINKNKWWTMNKDQWSIHDEQ